MSNPLASSSDPAVKLAALPREFPVILLPASWHHEHAAALVPFLVQHAPLAIRFGFDEKRFDVDGAYNVRYEIVKRRIDKAVVRGTAERLTQPAKIAIVHSHESEAAEWRDYIACLQKRGYLTRDVEDLELEELPGAQGLRTLRVGVDLTAPAGLAARMPPAQAS